MRDACGASASPVAGNGWSIDVRRSGGEKSAALSDWPVWLGEADGDHATLLRPSPDGALRTCPVNKRVGGPRNNDAGLIEEAVPP